MNDEQREKLLTLAEVNRKVSVALAEENNDNNLRVTNALTEAWAALKELAGDPLPGCGNDNCLLHYPKTGPNA